MMNSRVVLPIVSTRNACVVIPVCGIRCGFVFLKRAEVYIINPGHLASLTGEECPFFLLDQPQRFARGITCLFDDIPLRKAETIKSQLIAHLGRNTYYRCKQKKRLVRPKEQAYIKKLFLAQGITEEPKYDEYMEYYDLDRD